MDFLKVKTESDEPYIADDFDVRTTTNASQSGEINQPKRVGDQPGTLGWYYSTNNNIEPNTPITDFPYSRTYALEGPDPTVTTSAGPGDVHRMGGGHEVKNERQLIGANDLDHYLSLRSNFVTSSLPVTGYKYINTDPDGKKSVSFVDADGRSLASATLTGSTLDNWSYSYYNDLGQLIASVAPNGVNTGSTAPPTFVTTYKYDQLGRMIETTSPDEGTSQFVYSTDGKIRFSQNEEQRNADPQRFSYTNYDYLGRLIESGEYTTGTYLFEPHSINTAPASNSVLNIIDIVGQATGISRKISTEEANCSDYSFIEYDYENLTGITDPPASFQANLDGQVSRTENQNAITLYSYDEFGQVIKTWQLIKVANPPVAKTIEYTYDYFGNVTEVAYEKDSTDSFHHHYSYDANQRLTQVYTSKNGVDKTLRGKYEYYIHGPLKRIELFDGSEELQGIDYTYTINGALKTINHADPTSDPGSDGNDVFGETLQYFDNDYSGAGYTAGTQTISGFDNQYAGLLKAMSWHSPAGNHEKQTYAYDYDDRNQLQNALWGAMTGSAGSYGFSQASPQSYREGVPSYDKNGNIQSLVRNDKLGAAIANYAYVYESNKNRLDKVNHNSALLIDYSYNSIGQMTRQVEDGKDFDIIYTAYGLVSEIHDNLNNNQVIQKYLYDDRGNLLQKIHYHDGSPELYTTYISDVAGNVLGIYQHGTTAMSPEQAEVPIYGAGRFAVYKPTSETYFYEISDHLGNVRAVIGSEETDVYSTNMESPTNSGFIEYNQHDDDLMDHTDAGDTYIYTQLLNGGYAGRVGLTKSLAISPGDVIKVEAYGKYRESPGTGPSLDGFAAALTSAFGLASGLPGDPGVAYGVLDSYGGLIEGGEQHGANPNAPKAFLNILLFDKSYNLVDAAYRQIDADYVQVSETVKADHDYMVREVTVTEPGYAYIFFSNEDEDLVDIHFDDITITHTHSNIVAGADYYPYGLTMDGREIDDEPYRYGYQGQFSEMDVTTGMQEFELRMYDARIGRWLSPDPYGQFASSYLGMGNAPHMGVDSDGGFWGMGAVASGAVIGAAAGTVFGLIVDPDQWYLYSLGGAGLGALGGAIYNASTYDLTGIGRTGKGGGSIGRGSAVNPAASHGYAGTNVTLPKVATQIGRQILESAIRNAGDLLDDENNSDVEIVVQRIQGTDNSTTSRFNMRDENGNNLTGYFLEPAGPSSTVKGSDRRIPPGVYDVVPWNSAGHPNTFNVQNVPGRDFILIHTGNTPAHTEGCFLPGTSYGIDNVSGSTIKMNQIRTFINNNPGRRIIMFLREIHNP